MKKTALPLLLALSLLAREGGAEGLLKQGRFISQRTFDLIQELAQEKKVVSDIEDQNRQLTDEGKVREIQDQWLQSTEASDLVKAYRQKPSCQAMRQCFSKEISIVDCFTLDAQGRVVGTLFKPHDFVQEQDPSFTNCFNHGQGRVFVSQALPVDRTGPVEISMPVMDGAKTVGVLVATVLPER
jgi:hypothetical protein